MKTGKKIWPVNIAVNSKILEAVNKYEYLGSTVSEKGDGIMEIKRRLAIAINKLMSMNGCEKESLLKQN